MPRFLLRLPTVLIVLVGCCASLQIQAATTNVTFTVSSNTDDASQDSGGTMYVSSVNSYMSRFCGYRFQNVTIPAGATITSATLQVYAYGGGTTSFSVDLLAQDADNPSTFTSSGSNISGRTGTSAQTVWSVGSSSFTDGQSITSPDFASSIQEVVDRSGWASGNALVVLTTHNSGDKGISQRDRSTSYAPKLHITYSTGGSTFYVRTDGDDSNTGTGDSTSEAWQTIDRALTSSSVGEGAIIYVRSGTYNEEIAPTRDGTSSSPIQVIADRDGSIFGGIGGNVVIQAPSGTSAFDLEFDDYIRFTGLTLQGNGTDTVFLSDCAGVVFNSCEVSSGTDGFNIAGSSTVTLSNCLIRSNSADGIGLHGGTTTVYNCTVVANGDDGIDAGNNNATVVNSIIANNGDYGFSRQSDGDGTFSNFYNLLHNNTSGNYNGASTGVGEISSDPLFVGGSDYHLQSGSPAIDAGADLSGTVDNDMDGNARPNGSSHDMGAYENTPSTDYYVRSDGSDSNSGTGPTAGEAWATVEHAAEQSIAAGSIVHVQAGTYAGAISAGVSGNSGSPIQFIADRSGTVTGWPSGEVYLQSSSGNKVVDIDGEDYLEFYGFTFDGEPGDRAIAIDDSQGIVISHCEIYGGNRGIEIDNDAEVTVLNCLIHNNNRGIEVIDGTADIWNCTIADNTVDGFELEDGTATVTNCIIANNGNAGIDYNNGTFTHTYNLVFGNSPDYEGTSASTGETSVDPEFVASDNYRIGENSPAIDAGTNASGTIDDDLAGTARPINGLWDMGCYEGPGLIGHWILNETTGTNATDSSPFGQDGTYTNGVTLNTAGPYPGDAAIAAAFDGSNDRVTLPSATHDFSNGITLAAWVKPSATPSPYASIVAFGNGSTVDDIWFGWQPGYGLEIFLTDTVSGASNTFAADYIEMQVDVWEHCVVTIDAAGDAKLYRNGVETASKNVSLPTNVTRTQNFIGHSAFGDPFPGILFDVRMYNRAISAEEVSELYGLVGHWEMNESTGTTAADSTGYANDATLAGATWTSDCAGNYALEFDGAGGIAATDSDFDPPPTGTVAFWMRSAGNPGARSRPFGNGGDWEMRQESDGTLSFDIGGEGPDVGAGPDAFITNEGLSFQNRWYHVVAKFDADDDSFEVYIDGTLVNSGINGNDMTEQVENILSFGTRTGSTEYWEGALRDFRIYNRPISNEEIGRLSGLLAHWRLNESSGSVADDAGALDNDATYVASPTLGVPGPYPAATGTAVALNGTSQSITSGQSLLSGVSEFTIMGWIRPDDTAPDKSFFGQNGVIELGIDTATNQIDLWTAAGGSINATVQLPYGKWSHLSATGSGTELRLYVNGRQVASGGSSTSNYGSSGNAFKIGEGVLNSTGDYLPARVDDVRVYGRLLCPHDVNAIYKEGRPSGVRIIEWVETR